MTHDEYQEQISQLLDGELEESVQPSLFSHLGTCVECRDFFRNLLRLRFLLSNERVETIPAGLDQRISSTLLQATHRPKLWQRRLSIPIPIAALLFLALVVGGIAVTSELTTEPQVEVIYVPTMPTVEVQGYYFESGN